MRGQRRIWLRPLFLIERLDDMVIFRQRLAQAEREYHFAIGEMAENLARVPFTGRGAAFHAFRTEFFDERGQARGRYRDHFTRITAVEKRGVRIGHQIIVLA